MALDKLILKFIWKCNGQDTIEEQMEDFAQALNYIYLYKDIILIVIKTAWHF